MFEFSSHFQRFLFENSNLRALGAGAAAAGAAGRGQRAHPLAGPEDLSGAAPSIHTRNPCKIYLLCIALPYIANIYIYTYI